MRKRTGARVAGCFASVLSLNLFPFRRRAQVAAECVHHRVVTTGRTHPRSGGVPASVLSTTVLVGSSPLPQTPSLPEKRALLRSSSTARSSTPASCPSERAMSPTR
jgi:hypothetical protein